MSLDIWITAPVDRGHVNGPKNETLWEGNATHNLVPMWDRAGCYEALYHSEDKRARDVVAALRAGLEAMRCDPESFRALEPENKWGTYDGAVRFLKECIEAFTNYPNAIIGVSR